MLFIANIKALIQSIIIIQSKSFNQPILVKLQTNCKKGIVELEHTDVLFKVEEIINNVILMYTLLQLIYMNNCV